MPGRLAGTPQERLADALRAVDAGVSWTHVRVGVDDRPDWVRCADLVREPERLRGWQQRTADAYGGGADDVDPTLTAAGLVLDAYLAAVVLPAVGAFHLRRVVPDLHPAAVALRLGPPGSPVAATAVLDAEPVEGDPGPAELRERLRAHAAAFLAAYAPLTRFGRRTCWAAVTDAVDTAFLTAGWVSGEPGRAADESAAVLGSESADAWAPGAGGSTLHQLTDRRGRRHWTRRRHGCCFLYRMPAAAACLTCPRVSDAERAAQAADWD